MISVIRNSIPASISDSGITQHTIAPVSPTLEYTKSCFFPLNLTYSLPFSSSPLTAFSQNSSPAKTLSTLSFLEAIVSLPSAVTNAANVLSLTTAASCEFLASDALRSKTANPSHYNSYSNKQHYCQLQADWHGLPYPTL